MTYLTGTKASLRFGAQSLFGCLLLALAVSTCDAQTVPPKGMYVSLGGDLLNQFGSALGTTIANSINTNHNLPETSGETPEISYTFKNFVFDIDPEGFFTTANWPAFFFGWNDFKMLFQFDYHMKTRKGIIKFSESGYIQITTTKPITLEVQAMLDFSGNTVTFNSKAVQLGFKQGDINIHVKCTNTICTIPTSKIASGVAQSFVPTFQTGISNAINAAANQYINGHFPTKFDIAGYQMSFAFDGSYNQFNKNVVFYLNGQFNSPNPPVTSPFNVTAGPNAAYFANQNGNINFIFTDYFADTLLWALQKNGAFNFRVTNTDLPSSLAGFLNTNNAFFDQAVPALTHYSNLNMSLAVSLVNGSFVLNNPTSLALTFQLDFHILNVSGHEARAFSLWLRLTGKDTLQPPSITNGMLNISVSLSNFNLTVLNGESYIGGVVETQLIQAAILMIFPNLIPASLPPISIPMPTGGLTFNQPGWTSGPHYFGFFAKALYQQPADLTCPGGTKHCPLGNTCCQWGGNWGCCTMPSGVCCPSGCCPHGSKCNNGGCKSFFLN